MSTAQLPSPPSLGGSTSSISPPGSASLSESGSSSSSITDLPASAYDGSHLHWKAFRQHVLAPHHIRVLESPTKGSLPDAFLAFVDAQSKNINRFNAQNSCFREQVSEGRGFGPSPLFPPNLLPSIEHQPRLARCMVPAFTREALPQRAANHSGPLYELSVPRPGLGCGFSSLAFSNEEINILPSFLVGTGTSVDFSTGYISPSHAVYCPFLVFERAFGKKEHRLEAANNQCAIGGAYCCRTLHMLYAKAYPKDRIPYTASFSCTVDNDFAIINYHWISHDGAYLMAPLCKFDLRQNDHFSHFDAWIDAIGEWALAHLLPQVKAAIATIHRAEKPSPGFIEMKAAKKLILATESNKNDTLIKSLKTTFDNIPWRFEDDEFTPVSSSCASWGSPMVDDMILSNLTYPSIPRIKSLKIDNQEILPISATPTATDVRMAVLPPSNATTSPPPAYTYNSDLISLKRLDQAMDEIRDLHAQLETMKDSSTDFRTELSGLRDTLSTMLRKESTVIRTRNILARRISSPDLVPSSPTDGPVLALPPRAHSRSQPGPQFHHRRPGSLHIKTDLSQPSSNLKQITLPPPTPPSAARSAPSTTTEYDPTIKSDSHAKPGPTLTLSCNGVDVVLSPTHIRRQPLSFDSHKSPLSARSPTWSAAPRTPITTMQINKPPLPSPTHPEDKLKDATTQSHQLGDAQLPVWQRWYTSSSHQTQNVVRWIATLGAGYVLVSLVPTEMVKWFVVGCAADYCLKSIQCGDSSKGLISALQGQVVKAKVN